MKLVVKCLVTAVALGCAVSAQAHVSVANGPIFSDKNNVITLNIPHGCDGVDTYRVEVTLPEDFSSTRPMDSAFWQASVVENDEGNITQLIWLKDVDKIILEDDNLYQVTFRSRVPDLPFSKAYFPTVQYCRNAQGEELTSEWTAIAQEHGSHAANAKPAPSLTIYPERFKGWNKYTIAEHVHNLSMTFSDAEIVWAGSAAFSPNPNTMSLINNDASVSELDAIHPGTEVWVKY